MNSTMYLNHDSSQSDKVEFNVSFDETDGSICLTVSEKHGMYARNGEELKWCYKNDSVQIWMRPDQVRQLVSTINGAIEDSENQKLAKAAMTNET